MKEDSMILYTWYIGIIIKLVHQYCNIVVLNDLKKEKEIVNAHTPSM